MRILRRNRLRESLVNKVNVLESDVNNLSTSLSEDSGGSEHKKHYILGASSGDKHTYKLNNNEEVANIQVSKFVSNPQNQVYGEKQFNNGDEAAFDATENLTFDGKMKLKTNISETKLSSLFGNGIYSEFKIPELKEIINLNIIPKMGVE